MLYSREQARRSLLNTAGFRAISQVSTMVGYIVLVRALSAQAFGVYSLLYACIPVISTAASLGLELTLKRFQPEYLRAGNTAASAWLLRVVTVARLASNVLILVLVLLGWNLVAPLFGLQDYRAEFALFGPLVLLYFQGRILELALASNMLHRYGVGATVLLSITKLIAYLVLASSHALTLRSAILIDTLGYGLAYVFMRTAYRVNAADGHGVSADRPPPPERRRMWRYALYNNFNDAGSILLYVQTDNFFIAALLTPIAVGAYAFYTRINAMASNLTPIRLFENVLQPLVFAVPPAEAHERLLHAAVELQSGHAIADHRLYRALSSGARATAVGRKVSRAVVADARHHCLRHHLQCLRHPRDQRRAVPRAGVADPVQPAVRHLSDRLHAVAGSEVGIAGRCRFHRYLPPVAQQLRVVAGAPGRALAEFPGCRGLRDRNLGWRDSGLFRAEEHAAHAADCLAGLRRGRVPARSLAIRPQPGARPHGP